MCNTYRKKGIKINLYGFPKENPNIYKQWLDACGILEEDEIKYHPKVCDKCFTKDDFANSNSNNQRRKLKINSIPVRNLLGKRPFEESNVSIN